MPVSEWSYVKCNRELPVNTKPPSKSAFELLSGPGGPVHASLLHKARYLKELETKVLALIPTPLKEHCRVANVRDGVLILQTDSSIWATKARFLASDLLQELGRRGMAFQQIRINTRPQQRSSTTQTHQPVLSSTTADLLEDLANTVTIPPLADALRRLAKNKKR